MVQPMLRRPDAASDYRRDENELEALWVPRDPRLHFWVPRQQSRKKWRARLLSIWSVTSGYPP